jgi:prevent-host-death family protein
MEWNIGEAKIELSQLIERALSGEEVISAKAGKPIVKLVPIAPLPKRVLGSAAGAIRYTEGWDAPMATKN